MDKFKQLLNEQYCFPTDYTFKFVVKANQKLEVVEILKGGNLDSKESRTGKYVSITSKVTVDSSDHIIEIYQKVTQIPGVISL